jgi:catechol 2,3-dioxygenase-like lactoylglutathione lyase family enzyme
MEKETTIPVLPCVSIDETLDFYRVLGFEMTYRQTSPNPYAVVRRGGFDLHFFGLKGLKPSEAFSACLVIVPEVEDLHRVFAEALRGKFGKVPITGFPRITRMRKGQGRFTLVDPSGNSIIFIRRQEPGTEEPSEPGEQARSRSRLAKAIETAAVLRDSKGDDAAAARLLDAALGRNEPAEPIDRARALAARAELAVALGDTERARTLRAELQQISLSVEDRDRYRDELQAADQLEQSQR